jgi:hypothetical protein
LPSTAKLQSQATARSPFHWLGIRVDFIFKFFCTRVDNG